MLCVPICIFELVSTLLIRLIRQVSKLDFPENSVAAIAYGLSPGFPLLGYDE